MSSRIRMQADDFLNAYRVLEESNGALISKPEKPRGSPLNRSVTAFGVLPAMGVSIVCLAFSLELYIKDLYYTLNLESPRSHNILKLFEALPEEIRQEVFDCDSISENPFATRGDMFSTKIFSSSYSSYDRFIDQVTAISDGFEKWRYSYESTTLRYDSGFALSLIEAVKSVADSRRMCSVL